MGTILLRIAAVMGAAAVATGAFAAHALRARLSAPMLAAFQTGVLYHWLHTLAVLGLVAALPYTQPGPLKAAATCLVLGTVLFSGSLYALALTDMRSLGMLTPLGGGVLIVGWLLLAYAACAPSAATG